MCTLFRPALRQKQKSSIPRCAITFFPLALVAALLEVHQLPGENQTLHNRGKRIKRDRKREFGFEIITHAMTLVAKSLQPSVTISNTIYKSKDIIPWYGGNTSFLTLPYCIDSINPYGTELQTLLSANKVIRMWQKCTSCSEGLMMPTAYQCVLCRIWWVFSPSLLNLSREMQWRSTGSCSQNVKKLQHDLLLSSCSFEMIF